MLGIRQLLLCNSTRCSSTAASKQLPRLIKQASSSRTAWLRSTPSVIQFDTLNSQISIISREKAKVNPNATYRDRAETWFNERVVAVFFPEKYPGSVTANYASFAQWNFVGNVAGTMTGVLSTQALLSALGLGMAGSLPLAATLNWIIKDGFGLLGGVLYTSVFSGHFDTDPKRYRFSASVALQVASLCEIATVLIPHMFLLSASISNIGKNIAWLALAGTRAQMHHSMCTKSNLGDVTAKAGSQATAAALIGTGLGVALSAIMGSGLDVSLSAFVPLSAISVACVYKSNCVIATRSFNLQRSELMLIEFLSHGKVLSPEQVSVSETFVRKYRSIFKVPLDINPSLQKLDNLEYFNAALKQSIHDDRKYVITRTPSKVHLWFLNNATGIDVMEGMYESCKLRHEASSGVEQIKFPQLVSELKSKGWRPDDVDIVDAVRRRIDVA